MPNKATLELKAFTDSLFADEEYRASLIRRLKAGEANHIEKYLFEHRFGKPKEQHEHSGALTITWQT